MKAIFGLPLTDAELETFRACTGRSSPRPGGYLESTLVIGRRGGKSLVLALIAAYLATFKDWTPFLTPGERGHVIIIAADKKQAGSIFRYLKALLSIPLLGNLIERETQEVIELSNRISIEVLTANFRTVRGRTVVASLCDELAFWMSDENSSSPDSEIIAALRPAAATIPGAVLLKASSPYARRGVLYEDHRKHFGQDSDVLVWQADTRTMNPTVPQSFIDAETEKDPANAAAEYGAQFRTDVESFIAREVIDAAVVAGRYELPPLMEHTYFAFVDPSGGSADSMTLAISHREGDVAVLDLVREVKPPFNPSEVVGEFVQELRRYGIGYVRGDRYGAEWVASQFRERGIEYRVSDQAKSDIYKELLPLLNSGKIALLDHPRLIAQLCGLERRTARSGKDSIDHAPGGHDDIANAVAGALVRVEASRRAPKLVMSSLPMNQPTDYSGFSPEPFRQKRYRVDRDGKLVPTWSTDQEIIHILGGVPPGR